jgi:subtilase family serine protease
VYASYLTGQSLTLPRRLRHGVYCLGIRVDPLDRLWESDETNNDAVKAFRLHRTTIEDVERNDVCSS